MTQLLLHSFEVGSRARFGIVRGTAQQPYKPRIMSLGHASLLYATTRTQLLNLQGYGSRVSSHAKKAALNTCQAKVGKLQAGRQACVARPRMLSLQKWQQLVFLFMLGGKKQPHTDGVPGSSSDMVIGSRWSWWFHTPTTHGVGQAHTYMGDQRSSLSN